MPWKETDVLSQRIEFVVRARRGDESISELCREFGISRKTGHKWLSRFEEGNFSALADRSRRPIRQPEKTPKVIEERVVELRLEYGWSGRKLQVLLAREGVALSTATIDRIIKRRGLVSKEASTKAATKRFERSRPNELWQMDFKGEYLLRGGGRCYPLSILDDHSRYAVGVYALARPSRKLVQPCIEKVFQNLRRTGSDADGSRDAVVEYEQCVRTDEIECEPDQAGGQADLWVDSAPSDTGKGGEISSHDETGDEAPWGASKRQRYWQSSQ